MTTYVASASNLGLGKPHQSVLSRLWPSPRRQATRPPIFLLKKNQISQSSVNKLLSAEPAGIKEAPKSPALPFPEFAGGASSRTALNASGLLSRAWSWIRARQMARFSTRRLRVAETVSLGEKRFVAVIQVDGLQYLIGGGGTNVALLAQLTVKESFGDLLKETMTVPVKQMIELTAGQTQEEK
jgi:hypothetical protein